MSDYFERLEAHLLDAVDELAAAPPRERRAWRGRSPRTGRGPAWAMVTSAVAVAVAVLVLAASLHHRGAAQPSVVNAAAPTIDGVTPRVPAGASEVLATDGTVLGYIGGSEGRVRIPLSAAAVPALLRAATTATVDPRTLALRLVHLLYLRSSGPDARARSERIARGLAAARSRGWILTEFVNDVAYGTLGGTTAIGAQEASELFFGKPVTQLDLAQTALLAALPDDPVLSPPLRASAALRVRGRVLRAMLAAGSVTPAAAARAEHSALQLHPSPARPGAEDRGLVAYVAQALRPLVGAQVIAGGGLIVHTTIDAGDQAHALAALRQNGGNSAAPVAALASVDPRDGHIVALADNRQEPFAYAADVARQPGSAFTVFTLLALIRDVDGDPAKTTYLSHFLAPGWLPGHPTYSVRDYEESYQGPITVARAVASADNTVFAQLGVDLGAARISAIAHAMGITAPLTDTPSEALGGLTTGVSPLQMADADATLAGGGLHIAPTIVSRVTLPDGSTVVARAPIATRVLSAGEAAEATKVLRTVLTAGTGTAASFGCPAAGKTGSTSDFSDAWFAGYTPTLATTVWLGHPDGRPMADGFGGVLAAPIWRDYMLAADPDCSGARFPTAPWSGRAYPGAHATVKR